MAQASVVTSEESRGVDFAFGGGLLKLTSRAASAGRSVVSTPAAYDGPPVVLTLDPSHLADALKAVDDSAALTVSVTGGEAAAVFRAGDGYAYVVMPLTREGRPGAGA